ncbi:MAG: GreA/GreB family elongation factor [Rhodoferax sp.]|uniref:GreA/GreB family elongation factor n=1 Tax=Rhodoferax sp. TaxID=50421 RepID=UPI001B446994|nr:GreA/GreB family elongation factor [Rhodoferax sp.]MBP9907416.1 GreA/GreB family elongation factor [Rhodoferax sp.]
MASLSYAERTLTQLDVARLSRRLPNDKSSPLVDWLDEATVVEATQVPDDLITMNSLFMVEDLQSGETKNIKICYPESADPAHGNISVLSPVGASFLGRRVGETVVWRSPQGKEHSALVKQVLFQPEACGDYAL